MLMRQICFYKNISAQIDKVLLNEIILSDFFIHKFVDDLEKGGFGGHA